MVNASPVLGKVNMTVRANLYGHNIPGGWSPAGGQFSQVAKRSPLTDETNSVQGGAQVETLRLYRLCAASVTSEMQLSSLAIAES